MPEQKLCQGKALAKVPCPFHRKVQNSLELCCNATLFNPLSPGLNPNSNPRGEHNAPPPLILDQKAFFGNFFIHPNFICI